MSWLVVADLAARDGKRDYTAVTVGYSMDFGPGSAA